MKMFELNVWYSLQIFLHLQSEIKNGSLAEWLGGGLQNRIRRFESARNLNQRVVFPLFFILQNLVQRTV